MADEPKLTDAEDQPIPTAELIVGQKYLCWYAALDDFVIGRWHPSDRNNFSWYVGSDWWNESSLIPYRKLTPPAWAKQEQP